MRLRYEQIPNFAPIAISFFLILVVFLVGGTNALSVTVRVLFILFLPGFSILQAIVPDEFDFLERVILSPVIGIAFTSLMALYFTLLNVPINEYAIITAILLLSVPLLAYSWKQGKLRKTSCRSFTISSKYSILILSIIASIVLISVPFPKNGILIPMGDDPATSTLAATMIVQQGEIPQSWAPYFPEQSQFTYPPGYPSVIAFLYLLDPAVPMPALVSFFSAFFAIIHGEIFVLTRRVLNDYRVALCSAIFSALLSVSFYQMIVTGRFPALVGLSLTLSLLLFSYLFSITGKCKMLILAGITLASLFLTYTLSFITATLFVILFFSFGLIFFKHRRESLLGVTAIITSGITLSSPWVLNIFNRLTIEVPTREYETLLLWFETYSLRSEIGSANIFMYYGYWLFLFGIIGLLLIKVRRRIGSFLLAWFLSIFLLILNEIFKIHFPGWYYLQSGTFLNPTLSLPFTVLAGFGFVKAYDFLKKRAQNSSYKLVKTKHIVLVATLLLSTVILGATIVFWKPETTNDFVSGLQTNRMATADYNAIIWILHNTNENAVIFNDHWIGTPSTWIPAISHRRIVMPLLSISEVGWSNIMFTRQDESIIVAKHPNSSEALSILEKYNVSYIYLSDSVSAQVQEWRNNYDAYLFLSSPHYEVAFNENNAWVIKVIY